MNTQFQLLHERSFNKGLDFIAIDLDEVEDYTDTQTENGVLYGILDDLDTFDYLTEKLVIDSNDNYYLLFSNNGWLFLNSAINVKDGTIGYFNYIDDSDTECEYEPVTTISSHDIRLLTDAIDRYYLSDGCDIVKVTEIK
ncbi:hypothetical protein [Ligilactobacillus salivarius]|uniref:Uncharacterized protein n=1 Tax=Ligilactobacillus salivarius TaxID=1624 RepID=A0A089QIG7_9LACO|nr:hypothetical protein [Ligilactobacillus salivarius]AIR11628.1 Hypothetical protein LSJ_3008 [Ligilactobacillus salivarius]